MQAPYFETEGIRLFHADCMDGMKEMKDKAFELACVDVQYGIGEDGSSNHTRGHLCEAKRYLKKGWDDSPPPIEYFRELFRVSKNQIIWGVNHFVASCDYHKEDNHALS